MKGLSLAKIISQARINILLLLVYTVSVAGSLFAQGRVTGIVTLSGGVVIDKARVTAKRLNCVSSANCDIGGVESAATTDGSGRYVITLLPGRYLVQAVSNFSSFDPYIRRVSVKAGHKTKLNIELHFKQPAITDEDFRRWLVLQIGSQLRNSGVKCGITSNRPQDREKLEKTNQCVLRALARHKAFTAKVGLMAVDSDDTSILISDGSGVAKHAYASYHFTDLDATLASQQPLVWETCTYGLQSSADNPHVLECKKPAPR